MNCMACMTILDRVQAIQFLDDGSVIVIGHCPQCDRGECTTPTFIPVFVDECQPVSTTSSGRLSCYLLTNPGTCHLDILHRMARKLDIERSAHNPHPVPHYDLSPEQRSQALKLGAVPLDRLQFIQIMNEWRRII